MSHLSAILRLYFLISFGTCGQYLPNVVHVRNFHETVTLLDYVHGLVVLLLILFGCLQVRIIIVVGAH